MFKNDQGLRLLSLLQKFIFRKLVSNIIAVIRKCPLPSIESKSFQGFKTIFHNAYNISPPPLPPEYSNYPRVIGSHFRSCQGGTHPPSQKHPNLKFSHTCPYRITLPPLASMNLMKILVLLLIFGQIYLSSNMPINKLAYDGAHFVPITHPRICR